MNLAEGKGIPEPIADVVKPPKLNVEKKEIPGVAPLNLGTLTGEKGAISANKTEAKKSKFGKKSHSRSDESSDFVVFTPRQNEYEPQNSLFGLFTVLRQEYKNETADSPKSVSRNVWDGNKVIENEDVATRKAHFKALKRAKRKAGKQASFAKKIFNKEIKFRAEQVVSRDMSDSIPEVTLPKNDMLPLHHGSVLPRRVTAVVGGTMVAIAGNSGHVTVYDGETGGNPKLVLYEKPTEVYDIAWLGGDVIGTVGNDGFLRTWSTKSGDQLDEIYLIRSYGTAMVALDTENVLVGTAEGDLIRFSHKSGMKLKHMASKIDVHDNSEAIYNLKDLDPNPAIEILTIGPAEVKESIPVRPTQQYKMDNEVWGERRIWKICAYRNEVVSVSEDRTCALTNARDFHCYGKWRHKHPVLSAAINSCYVVTGSLDTLRIRKREDDLLRVRVWKGVHGQTWVHSLTLYKTDILISTGGDGNIVMYNLLTEQPIHRIGTSFSAVWDTALMPGNRLAICGPWEKDGYIMDLEEFEEEDQTDDRFSIWNLLSPRSAQRSPRSEGSTAHNGSPQSEDTPFTET